jgi:4-amino-4-deoxy-L-arabinose transferase-like glycosyltransferase
VIVCWLERSKLSREGRRALWWMVGVLLLGAALRFVALEESPPGLAPDEASNGYDAYSIALTGRDQHGEWLPTTAASLNDYRMPGFIYIAVPFVSIMGLAVTSVRMAAATCGWLALPVVYWLGARMFDRRVGVVAALLLALSPWHLPSSRIGLEYSLVTLLVTASVAAFWQWHIDDQRWRWMFLTAVLSGLTLYAHSITKLLLPLLLAGMGSLLWSDLKAHWRQAIIATAIVGLIALPIILDTLRMPDLMQARYNQVAVLDGRPLGEGLAEAAQNWWLQISPRFLFISGDLDALQHPPGLGQLYWVQLPLLVAGIVGGVRVRHRRRAVAVLISWIAIVGVPVALTRLDSPGSGNAMRAIAAVVPWQLLTAAGFGWLWSARRGWRAGLALLLGLGLTIQAIPYLNYYFTQYPREVALRFDDGMRQAVEAMDAWDDDYDTVVFTDQASWPYLHILFFTAYDPHLLQQDLPVRSKELFAPVTRVGKYHVGDVERLYRELDHGLFVMPAWMLPGVEPLAVTDRSDGTPAFKIVGK